MRRRSAPATWRIPTAPPPRRRTACRRSLRRLPGSRTAWPCRDGRPDLDRGDHLVAEAAHVGQGLVEAGAAEPEVDLADAERLELLDVVDHGVVVAGEDRALAIARARLGGGAVTLAAIAELEAGG